MNVRANVAYGLKNRGWPQSDIPQRIEQMLKLVRLEGYDARMPRQLSGGQQQRVALARVLATNPRLVLLDEPLSALDAKLREALRVELKQILAAINTTAIVVTHDQEEAMSLADRIFVMNHGKIEQQGTPDEIYNTPASHFVASFVGRANWFRARLTEKRPDGISIFTTENGTRLLALDRVGKLEAVDIAIRPERMWLRSNDEGGVPANCGALDGRVEDAVNLGPHIQYTIKTMDLRLLVSAPSHETRFQMGAAVNAHYRASDCIVLGVDAALTTPNAPATPLATDSVS
jgi:putative spermidine/putrescine transport system ATP-binding protein/putrescine transport system ATP-binding protein